MPTVTLIGYRGTGKTTVARLLAARLGVPWWDADLELESRLGGTLADFIRARGEGEFREAEAATLAALLDRGTGVLATGGGAVLRADNRERLRRFGGLVVWLSADAAEIRRRLAADPGTLLRRPALAGSDPLAEVEAALAAREALYRETADVVIDSGTDGPAAIVDRIVPLLAAPPDDGVAQ